jgi:phytoene synthase
LQQLPVADYKAQRTGLMMAAIYRATLQEVVYTGCHVLRERISLPPLRKLWLALKTWFRY